MLASLRVATSHWQLRNVEREIALCKQRMGFVLALITVLTAVLLLRLSYLQVALHEHYSTLSWDNRVRVLPVAPPRGLIYSSDGELLAENIAFYDLNIIPERVGDMQATLAGLREWITIRDVEVERFYADLRGQPRFKSITLLPDLSERERAVFSVNLHRFPGVEVVARLGRHYPQGEVFAHVLGYVGRIDEADLEVLDSRNYRASTHAGKLGVERSREKVLHGTIGHQQVEVNSHGRTVRVLEHSAAVSGKDLHIGINASLQRVAAAALDGRRGAIVAIDTNNGNVLAAVSSPSYDPNLFVNGISTARYRALLNSPDRPLFNRFISGEYPPGSVLKPFWGLIALNSGVRAPEDALRCPGQMVLNQHTFRDWKRHGHTNLSKAIIESCDVYFYQLALDLGIGRMHSGLAKFGFGGASGLELSGERAGLLPSREWKRRVYDDAWYLGESVLLGIGQGYMLATPMQLARAVATLATGGALFEPRLVVRVGEEGEMASVSPSRRIAAGDDAHWEYIISSMREVVHGTRGTARRSGQGAQYEFAGKTGTAQKIAIAPGEEYDAEKLEETLRDHALFIAFAPVPAPSIAVAIIVENAGSGSAAAAPIARALFDHYLLNL